MSQHKADTNKNINLTIDGYKITVPEGTKILEAAKQAGIIIPTLCDHPDLCKRAVCRLCVVECDGRGKLMAACANDVWEGVKIVTNNERILSIRKMIIELLLANHPQDCLNCIRNKNCKLQSLAAEFGIRESPFRHDAAEYRTAKIESNTLVRDMGKCVKCGRCVEACKEIQSINSSHRSIHYEIVSPYNQALADGPCVFCGQCVMVCPVGAIYEHDQSAEAYAVLGNKECYTTVQISPALCTTFDKALCLSAGTVNTGRLITALKRLAFDKVFDTAESEAVAKTVVYKELLDRIKNDKQTTKPILPIITGCSAGCIKFMEDSYPDLKEHCFAGNDHLQIFNDLIKTQVAQSIGIEPTQISCISIEPCIARKFRAKGDTASPSGTDLVLTVNELARMFKQAGIEFNSLPETSFDRFTEATETTKALTNFKEIQPGIKEAEITFAEKKAKMLAVYGFTDARIILDSIHKKECDAAWVHIMSCYTPNSKELCADFTPFS